MNKRKIVTLAKASYTNNKLDKSKVEKIAPYLTRTELKQYIKVLKIEEMKRTITITVPFGKEEIYKKEFENRFPDKNILIQTDPSLIVGVRILRGDMLYKMDLRDNLEAIQKYLIETI